MRQAQTDNEEFVNTIHVGAEWNVERHPHTHCRGEVGHPAHARRQRVARPQAIGQCRGFTRGRVETDRQIHRNRRAEVLDDARAVLAEAEGDPTIGQHGRSRDKWRALILHRHDRKNRGNPGCERLSIGGREDQCRPCGSRDADRLTQRAPRAT